MIGIKIYSKPEKLEAVIDEWHALKIDTLFVGAELRQDHDFIARVKREGFSIFAVFRVFYAPERLQAHPEEYAITADGSQAIQEWLQFACPSSEDFINYRLSEIRETVQQMQPDGISLDFMRFFVFWEKVFRHDPKNITQTCFDERCLHRFQTDTGISIPGNAGSITEKSRWILEEQMEAWSEWKCQVILQTVKQLTETARDVKPDISACLHVVPWLPDDFDGAMHSVAAQDLSRLAEYIDVFSPMCYSHMLYEPPSWIQHVVAGQSAVGGKPVVPCIQVEQGYREEILSLDEFAETVQSAIQSPSSGIVFWSWEKLNQYAEKKDIVRKLLSAR